MYAPMGALLAMRGCVLAARSNIVEEMGGANFRARERHGDEATSHPGGGMWGKQLSTMYQVTARTRLPHAESPLTVIFWGGNPTSQTRCLYAAIASMTAAGNWLCRSNRGPELSRWSTDNTLERDVEYDPLASDAVGWDG